MNRWVRIAAISAATAVFAANGAAPVEQPTAEGLPFMRCQAEQTGGFHDYPGGEESYEPALFHPQSFTLEENLVFMTNLVHEERNVDLYLTMERALPMRGEEEDNLPQIDTTELECRRVRGANESYGYSCVNLPPSEMLLINAESLRFTRTAVGGWTFANATAIESDAHGGDSIFVEYGQCAPDSF
jgi:hypothetical protein